MDHHALAAHNALIADETPPLPEDICALCSAPLSIPTATSREVRVHCCDCFGRAHFCLPCLHQYHRLSPFHRLLRWNTAFRIWEKVTMVDMGLVLHGGHGGTACPHKLCKPCQFVMVHGWGVLKIKVSFCECARVAQAQTRLACPDDNMFQGGTKYDHDEALQLINMGLYPASWEEPRTAFTQDVIRASSLLTAQGGLSTQDFYTFIQCTTNNVAPECVPDQYRQLMVSQWEFDYLLSCKRNAVEPSHGLPSRMLVVLCPACPQPGKNMRPNWDPAHQVYTRYLDALFYSVDGNFHQKQRKKPMDKNDVALSEGAGYFVDSSDFAKYMDGIGPEEKEETTCHKFAAMGYGGHTGQVTGTVALVCQHLTMLPSSMVDLKGAKNQRAVDFAVVTGVQPYVGLRLLKLYYDIACQYMVHFLRRLRKWDKLLPGLRTVSTATLPEVQAAVGKFHVYGHTLACRTFQSPNFVPFNGRTDSEGSEREWPFINEAVARTQEMTSGHRHDAINTLISDLNIRQVHKMSQTLLAKLVKAEKRLALTTKYLARVEKGVAVAELVLWKAEEAVWLGKVVDIANHKELSNPYNVTIAALSVEATLSEIRTDFSAKGDVTAVGMVGAIQGMIDLEHQRRDMARAVRAVDRSKKRQRAAITKKVDDLLLEAELAVDAYNRYISPLVMQVHNAVKRQLLESGPKETPMTLPWRDAADDKACRINAPKSITEKPLDNAHLDALVWSVENVTLYLPSMYHSLIWQHPAVAPAVQIEQWLREGQANDALDNLRTHLTARYSLRDLRRQGQGPKHGKAVQSLAKAEKKVGEEAKHEYRRVRMLLRVLGMDEDDEDYKYLHDEDVKALIVEEDQYVLNSNSKEESWLWRNFAFIKRQGSSTVRKFYMHRMKPHWFRSCANRVRWEEEVRLLQEEMFHTAEMFCNERAVWELRGEKQDTVGRPAHAVYARKQAHRYLTLLEKCRSYFPLARITVVKQLVD
ncbi:hypothetical protein C8Q79DRAFT_915041 [Trametes meyenii]|nr:hypothetical protein C8Q79DRAFT_915041 [Trametes meyenii]